MEEFESNKSSEDLAAKSSMKNTTLAAGARSGKPEPDHHEKSATVSVVFVKNPITGEREMYRSPKTGQWVADVYGHEDPVYKKPFTLKEVPVSGNTQGTFQKLSADMTILLNVPDVRQIKNNNIEGMLINLDTGEFNSQNRAIPTGNLASNRRATVAPLGGDEGARSGCRLGNLDFETETDQMHKMPGMTILADPKNPRSSGMLVDGVKNETVFFNKERQNVTINAEGVRTDVGKFNFGAAVIGQETLGTGGFPGTESTTHTLFPRSNILLGVPTIQQKFWPDFVTIVAGLNIIYTIIRVGMVAADKIDARKKRKSCADKARERELDPAKRKWNAAQKKARDIRQENPGSTMKVKEWQDGRDKHQLVRVDSALIVSPEETEPSRDLLFKYKLTTKIKPLSFAESLGAETDHFANIADGITRKSEELGIT